MKLLVDGHNLLKHPEEYYENLQREGTIALKSRKFLRRIESVIREAGGEFEEAQLAEMPLAQFIVLAMRNDIQLKITAKLPTDDGYEVPF